MSALRVTNGAFTVVYPIFNSTLPVCVLQIMWRYAFSLSFVHVHYCLKVDKYQDVRVGSFYADSAYKYLLLGQHKQHSSVLRARISFSMVFLAVKIEAPC